MIDVGDVLEGKYRIERRIGAGSMAVVYRATDVMLDRPVAIKVMANGDPHMLQGEARAMARLRHENVVQVFAFGVHDGEPFLVIELVEGTNLHDTIVRQGPMPLPAFVAILEKIAGGLEAAHAQGIVHLDVKPANVLVGPHFRVCVTDFGLAGALRDPEVISGTPSYIAPESFLGTARPEEAPLCDQYALGITAYEMLTGHVPFAAASFNDLLRQAVEDPPPKLDVPSIPPAVQAAIFRAISKEPRSRFPSCAAFADAVRSAVTQSIRPRSRSVLIVDDDRHLRRLFSAVIEDAIPNARISTAADGLVAIELARERRPDLVLLDLEMPNLNGYDFLDQLRSEDALKEVPVIVVSGRIDPARIATLDVRATLEKPVDPNDLLDRVTRFLSPPP